MTNPWNFKGVIEMSDEAEKDVLTRRGFLGVGSAALAAAGMRSVENLAPQESADYKSKADRSASDPGPHASRMRMKTVEASELAAMNADAERRRCAAWV